jgi:hypothetical protein
MKGLRMKLNEFRLGDLVAVPHDVRPVKLGRIFDIDPETGDLLTLNLVPIDVDRSYEVQIVERASVARRFRMRISCFAVWIRCRWHLWRDRDGCYKVGPGTTMTAPTQ